MELLVCLCMCACVCVHTCENRHTSVQDPGRVCVEMTAMKIKNCSLSFMPFAWAHTHVCAHTPAVIKTSLSVNVLCCHAVCCEWEWLRIYSE